MVVVRIATLASLLAAVCFVGPVSLQTLNPEPSGDSFRPPEPLLLTPLLDAGRPDLARNYSYVVPVPGLNQPSYSGFINGDRALGNQLFFWFFISRDEPDTSPLLVWLNGGPGISSMQGMLWEHGPLEARRLPSGEVRVFRRQVSWANKYSVLYIDSPVGVGYSFSESGKRGFKFTTDEVKDDLYNFLVQFYQIFPEYLTRPLYLGGQAYGGKFVTALAFYIHEEIQDGRSNIPLTGIHIGGPNFHPIPQVQGIIDNFYTVGAISFADSIRYMTRMAELPRAYSNGSLDGVTLRQLYPQILPVNILPLVSIENYVSGEVVDDEAIEDVMNSVVARLGLHLGDKINFTNYNMDGIFDHFGRDYFTSNYVDELGVLLDNYKVLLYNGDYAVVDGVRGTERAILATPWSKMMVYAASPKVPWLEDSEEGQGRLRGFYTRVGRFCRVVIHGAGNQAARDQPESVFQMIQEFIETGCVE